MKYILLILFLLLTASCFGQNKKERWNHVRQRDRLKVMKDTMTVTGVIENCYSFMDGDFIMEIRLDSCKNLLNKVNIKKLKGLLEVEIICHHSTIFLDCIGYSNDIKTPKLGDHIKVIGAYVLDKIHGWQEIHPVFELEILK